MPVKKPAPVLRIKAIDSSAKGSFRETLRFQKLIDDVHRAEEAGDQRAQARCALEIMEVLVGHAYCPGGEDPEPLLAELSMDEFLAIAEEFSRKTAS